MLLLDEPTNHLDTEAVEWLEEYLRAYPKAAVIISHDRYFLDRVTTRTFEITNGALYAYGGNYTASMADRQRRREVLEKQYKDQMKEIGRIERMIEQQRRWNRERNIRMAEHKQKQLDRLLGELTHPEREEQTVRFTFAPARPTGQEVLFAEELKKRFGDKILYEHAEIHLYKRERVFLLGRNGCGKTTLLRQIVAMEPGVRFGPQIKVGYYDQTQELLKSENTVFDEISDAYPKLSGTEIRNALAAFLFKGGDVFKRIDDLSGGEKARVSLLKLMLSGANLLILDEPTNHLDIGGREALESALLGYTGSMLIVSHDRYFINKCAERIYELTPDGTKPYAGNYDYYAARRQSPLKAALTEKNEKPGGDSYRERKERASALRKLETQIEKAERRAQALSEEISKLKEKLDTPEAAADYQELLTLTGEIARLGAEEEEAVRVWEESIAMREELL